MSATWLICVPTVPARVEKFERLMSVLLPQTVAAGGAVKVMAWRNTGAPRLAELRDRMIEYADEQAHEYVSFIDDDDVVPAYFVREAWDAMNRGRPDHIGFWVEYFRDGVFQGDVEHSLVWRRWATLRIPIERRQKFWPRDWQHRRPLDRFPRDYRLVRDFTHIDPIRTEIARWGRFAEAGPYVPEDRGWCRQLRERLAEHHGSREAFVDKIMYHYDWRPQESMWDAKHKHRGSASAARPDITHPHFFWHKESL